MIVNNWGILKTLCNHKANIYTFENVKDEKTKRSKQELKLKYSDLQCYFESVGNNNLDQTEGSNNLKISGVGIFEPNLNIKDGDIIEIFIDEDIEVKRYIAFNVWSWGKSHIEVNLKLETEV